MATDSIHFPLQNAIKKILDDPNSRPALPDGSSTGDGISVGDGIFGKGDRYDTGKWSDLALNNGNVVVEVHNTTDSKSLYYHVGKVNGGKIDWDESHYYDKGVRSSVAINNNGLVAEVHKSQGLKDTFWHRLGQVEGGTIKWRKNDTSTEYGAGLEPSVAITDDELVVEVHQSILHDEGSGQLYYKVGRVKGDTIDWGESHYYDNGVQPSVAITNDGLAIEVHTSQNFNTLYYHVGRVKDDKTIDWGESHYYDNGVYPSVAITNDGLVVEVHQSQSHNTVWYRGTGQVNNNTLDGWDDKKKSQNYSDGTTPKVACNGRLAVETHSGADDQLLYSVLTLPAFRPQWYEDRGQNSYYYFSMGTGFGPWENKRIATSKTITVDPGAPFLLANITQSRESTAFPTGAMLTIQAPDGTIYNREESRGNIQAIKSGPSLQSLVIKEPIAGDYHITLTLPPIVAFFFAFETLPSGNLDGIIEGSQELQKRGLDRDREKQVAELLAMLWLIIIRERQPLLFLEEPVGYVTKSKVDISHHKLPTDLVQATNIIAFPVHTILTLQDFRIPPARPTTAPINGPVIEYVQNNARALLWLHARITQNHLNTGTGTNQAMRNFARRLGLPTDDAGHVIGNRVGGLGTVEWNIFPQNPNFNRGAYSTYVEQVFADAVRRYGSIEVWFRFHYNDPQHPNRPTSFDFCMLLPDGTVEINDLFNPENVPRGL